MEKRWQETKEATSMTNIMKIVVTTMGLCSLAIGAAAPASAQYYYYPRHHYWPGYGYRYYNPDPHCTYLGCCPRGWTVQGGVCKPYQGPHGPGWGYYRRWY